MAVVHRARPDKKWTPAARDPGEAILAGWKLDDRDQAGSGYCHFANP